MWFPKEVGLCSSTSFNLKLATRNLGVRIIHGRALYNGKYGITFVDFADIQLS